jgi:integrase
MTVAEYIAELIADFGDDWREAGSFDWWTGQLAIVESCYQYTEDHPAVVEYGLAPGTSKHFLLLGDYDFRTALRMRRATNLGAIHRNKQKRAKYDRLMARWEASLTRRGGGRRPQKPAPLELEEELTADPHRSMISERTQEAFGMTQSFVFDRALEAGHFGHRGDPWRLFNPRGTGGRAAKKKPYSKPTPVSAMDRNYPGAGFLIDLGHALAEQGEPLGDERRAGERYSYLPLIAWQLAARPGELCDLSDERIFRRESPPFARIARPSGHLKGKPIGVTRDVELARLTIALIDQHRAAGFESDRGALFASPTGVVLDPSNWTEDYLQPALAALCTGDGP